MQVEPPEPWQKLVTGTIKLNVCSDTAVDGKAGGLGIIARDSRGDMLQAWSMARKGNYNPVVTELEAIRLALLAAQQNGWGRVEVQLDIKAIAACLQAKTYPVLEAAIITYDIFLLSDMFESFIFSFCYKFFNRACSKFAKMAQRKKLLQSWKCIFPQWLLLDAALFFYQR